MSKDQVEILQRALMRERQARKEAEKILEEKSRELYDASKRLESLLDEKSAQLQGVFENIIDGYIVMDINGNILKCNEATKKLFGYDIEKESVTAFDLIYKDDIEFAKTCYKGLHETGVFKDFEVRAVTKEKDVRLVHINASMIIDEDGIGIAAQGIIRDITEERASEEQLINSESRLSSLILNLDSAVLLEDENRKIVLTNKKFCDLFNIPVAPELLKGQDCSEAAEQSKGLFKDEEDFVSRINELLKNKDVVLGDDLTMKNGRVLERDFIPITKDNVYRGHLWTYRDVTLSRTYRKRLEAQKEKYGSIIANMNLGLVEVNVDDTILMVNQSFTEMSGYSEGELLGKKAGELLSADENDETIKNENEKRRKGQPNSYELKAKTKSGETRHWLISGAPNYDINGELQGSIGIHLDITELKSLEIQKENLLEKLERSNTELQEYAHIVSHDLKSPLRSINALVNWLKEDNKDKLNDTSFQNLNHIETVLEKMEQLISDILDYSSIGSRSERVKEVEVNELVEEIIDIIYTPEHIDVQIVNKLPVIKGEKTKLQQLFQNLLSNSIKFIDKPKGKIEIGVKSKSDHYEFSVSDNGIGIDEKFHKSIFKIFHTLSKSKDSTGIGLSIVKKIVELHGGRIWLESKLNEGTTFYFTLKK